MDKTQRLLETQKSLAPPADEALRPRRGTHSFGAVRQPKNGNARRGVYPGGRNGSDPFV